MAKYIGQAKFKDNKFWGWLMEHKRYDENNEELIKRLLKYKPGNGGKRK